MGMGLGGGARGAIESVVLSRPPTRGEGAAVALVEGRGERKVQGGGGRAYAFTVAGWEIDRQLDQLILSLHNDVDEALDLVCMETDEQAIDSIVENLVISI